MESLITFSNCSQANEDKTHGIRFSSFDANNPRERHQGHDVAKGHGGAETRMKGRDPKTARVTAISLIARPPQLDTLPNHLIRTGSRVSFSKRGKRRAKARSWRSLRSLT